MFLGLGIYLVFGVGFDSSLPQKALHAPEWTILQEVSGGDLINLINSTGVLTHAQENMGASVVPTPKLWGKTGLWGEEPRQGSPWVTRVTSH